MHKPFFCTIIKTLYKFCFCHAACGSCAAERREPCQAGNRAALSGLPERHSPPVRRVTEAEFFYPKGACTVYRVLYRKWRPQTFSDVVGQPQVTKALACQIKENRLSHAYLFTGSRGTGKTSCAKIFAKAVNCLHPVGGDPCNECEICKGIDDGTVLDIVEIDAASNRGVDDIRQLREEVKFTPSQAKFRVYIVDEVHMLTIEAFNALLKTLEEPPEHVKFILATTEVQKLPSTILSRCQRYDFRRIEPEVIAKRLQRISEEEGASLNSDAAVLIARLADGGMRDALSLLDRCLSTDEPPITVQTVTAAAGIMGRDYLFNLCRTVANHDTAAALTILDDLHKASCDTERLCTELINQFRNLLIVHTVTYPEKLIVATNEEIEENRKLAAMFTTEAILRALSVLSDAVDAIKKTQNRRVEAEMALIRLCRPETDTSVSALAQRVADLEQQIKNMQANGIPVQVQTPVAEPIFEEELPLAPDNIPAQPEALPFDAAPAFEDEALPFDEDDAPPFDSDLLWDETPPAPAQEVAAPAAPEEFPFDGALPFDDDEFTPPEENASLFGGPAQVAANEPTPFAGLPFDDDDFSPPAPAATVSTQQDESSNGALDNRTWTRCCIEAEALCRPLIGHLADSTAETRGSMLIIHTKNKLLAVLLRNEGFSNALATATEKVLGRKLTPKVEL